MLRAMLNSWHVTPPPMLTHIDKATLVADRLVATVPRLQEDEDATYKS